MKLCLEDSPRISRRPVFRSLISRTTAQADFRVLQSFIMHSVRRAGIKLKAVMTKNRPSHAIEARSREHGPPKRCYLLELPTELLLEIISHLTVLPQACLALTCKRLFSISATVLESKSLRFSRDFAPLFHHYRNGHSFATTRWQLIKVLEDARWRACSRCLKLHSQSAFPPRQLRRNAETRMCILGDLAGVVDLCPCKKLTFRDKLELIEIMKIRQKAIPLLTSQFGGVEDRFCWHSCSVEYGPTQIRVEIFPELDGDDQLKIRTEYHLTTVAGQLGEENYMTARFGCAHRSVDLWLSGVCHTALCQPNENHCASCRRISVCSSCNTLLRCPRKQPRIDEAAGTATYTFWTERCLGAPSPIPDATWAAQRIHPAEALVDLDNCRELCPWRRLESHPPLRNAPSLEMDILVPAFEDQSLNQLYSSIDTY